MSDPLSFTSTTPRLRLPLLFAGQAQKEFIVNECLTLLDAISHAFAEAVVSQPPAAPVAGQSWIVASGATGAFAGKDGTLAMWDGSAWIHVQPREGMTVRLRSSGSLRRVGSEWKGLVAPAAPAGGTTVDVQARDTIATLINGLIAWGVFSQ